MSPLERLRHHVTGAIERGEAVAVTGIPASAYEFGMRYKQRVYVRSGPMSREWQNSAARRRCHAKFRAKLCRMLDCPIDSCYTTGELLRDARRQRAKARGANLMLPVGNHPHGGWIDPVTYDVMRAKVQS